MTSSINATRGWSEAWFGVDSYGTLSDMAKETIIKLSDDIDGGDAVEELTFALRGVEYEIDLNTKNVAALEKALDKYMSKGRKVSHRAPTRRGTVAPKEDLSAIREWAKANGYKVSERGRIAADVKEAFSASHG